MIRACRNGQMVDLDVPGELGVDFPFELGRMLLACIVNSDEDWCIFFNRPRRKPWCPGKPAEVAYVEELFFKRDRETFWRNIIWMIDQKIIYPWDARLNRFQVNQSLIRILA